MREPRGLLIACLVWLLATAVIADEPLHRHHDDRPQVDQKKAQTNGILRYESKRLILLTDIDPAKARELAKLVDQVYPAWEAQFGKLPEARDKSDFQITGYLMQDPDKFLKAGLLRRNPDSIVHGQNDGYQFWMHDQEWDYYREHLLLHEATHCVTQCREAEDEQRPLWFIEGMAEYFGAHQRIAKGQPGEGTLEFGIMPVSAEAAHGFGRIEMIRMECEAGRTLSAADILKLGPKEFGESRSTPYAWSWALCFFLASHPVTAEDYRQVCQQWETAGFRREFDKFWSRHRTVIEADWEVFRESLCYGFDLPRGATTRTESSPLPAGEIREVRVRADHGWQSTGISVRAEQSMQLSATGRVVLATTTKPWVSEPRGISIRYSEGRPIGRLQAAIQLTNPADSGPVRHWEFLDVGAGAEVPVKSAGTLYLRINDRWNELADNSGDFTVTIRAKDE